MNKQSKFFRVAVEGATVDGRVIERNWLEEMAAGYNPATYAARVNMEHIRGITADKPFKAYGDVLALRTEEVDVQINGKTEKKLALFAQIEPTDDLVAINADRQKLYTSVEISTNFATTGKAYLVGLAVTDNPASLGTEALQFVAHRKQDKANLFSAAAETTIEFEDKPAAATPESQGLFAAATEFFKQFTKGGQQEAAPPVQAAAPGTEPSVAALSAAIGTGFEKLSSAIEAMSRETKADLTKLRGEHETLKASVEGTDNSNSRRQLATGTGAAGKYARIDC
jgi:hypothetical protein